MLGQSLEGGSAVFWWGSDQICTPNPAPTMLGDPEGHAGLFPGNGACFLSMAGE